MKVIKRETGIEGNYSLMIPHFFVVFSGLASVISSFCIAFIPAGTIEDLWNTYTYLNLLYIINSFKEIENLIIGFIMTQAVFKSHEYAQKGPRNH